jgi:type I restriction enzyme, R subunit
VVGDKPKLDPIQKSGSGMVRKPEKVYMAEVIAKLNKVFGEDTTEMVSPEKLDVLAGC